MSGETRADRRPPSEGEIAKSVWPRAATGSLLDRGDPGQRRGMVAEFLQEVVDAVGGAFEFHQDALGVVQDPAAQAALVRQAVDGGPEPDALDDAADADAAAAPAGRAPPDLLVSVSA